MEIYGDASGMSLNRSVCILDYTGCAVEQSSAGILIHIRSVVTRTANEKLELRLNAITQTGRRTRTQSVPFIRIRNRIDFRMSVEGGRRYQQTNQCCAARWCRCDFIILVNLLGFLSMHLHGIMDADVLAWTCKSHERTSDILMRWNCEKLPEKK